MSLNDWLKNAWLIEHETSREEISDLVTVIDRDLRDCHSSGLSDYERAGSVSDQEAQEMIGLAVNLRAQFLAWLADAHSNLLPMEV